MTADAAQCGGVSDYFVRSICTTREDKAIGVVAGAWMGGVKAVVMMEISDGEAAAMTAMPRLCGAWPWS
jgi:sulfopyruvate decarboxylase TPP-binding subunit